ncbi:MAG TPA: multidrug effflux MFS transporter [Dermatophilaceae bacterium]|nr:multidrug effflux MFS transporter [Dermatophilaceae bacterium]
MTGRRRVQGGWLVLLLAALTSVGPFTVDTIFPGFPAIEAEFAATPVAVQQTLSIYLLTFGVMSLFHGPLSDAVGRKPVIVGGSILYAATSVACALAPSLPWLLTARAAQGLVAGAGMIVARTVVRDVFHGEQAQRAMSRMSMIFGVAPAAAPIVGGWLLALGSWRGVFWFLAAIALMLAATSATLLPETHPPALRTPLAPGALLRAVVDSTRDAGVRRLVAVAAFNFAGLFSYIAAAPTIIVTHLGLGPGDFGVLFVPVVTAMILGSWLTGRFAGRISGPRFLTIGFGTAVLGGILQLALDLAGRNRLPWVLAGPTLTGLGIALVFPIVTLALLELRPAHRGTLSSLQAFSSTMLNSLVAGLIVPVAARQLPTLTLTSLAFSTAGWLVWARHWRHAAYSRSAGTRPAESSGGL